MRIRRFSTDRVRSHHSRRRSPPPPPPSPLSGNREHLGDFPSFPSDFQPVPRPSRGHLLPRIFLPSALVPSFRNTSLRAFALRYLSPPPRSGLMCSSRAGTSGVAARLGVHHPLRLRVNSPLFAGLSPSLPGLSTRSSVLLAPDERFSQTRSAHSLGRFYLRFSFFPISSVSPLPPTVLGSICLPSQLGVPQRSGGLAD